MLLAKLLIAGSLVMPVVGYPEPGQAPDVTKPQRIVEFEQAKISLMECVARNVTERTSMSPDEAFVDAMEHRCLQLYQVAARILEDYETLEGNAAYEKLIADLVGSVEYYVNTQLNGIPGL